MKLVWLSLLVAGTAHASPKINVVYGNDDRVEYYQTSTEWKSLADSTVALIPARALKTDSGSPSYGQSYGLCQDEPFYTQPALAVCSGFLIAPDTVVTAGHCIPDATACADMQFVFGYRLEGPGTAAQKFPATEIYSCSKMIATQSIQNGADFAIVKLDRAVIGHQPLSVRTQGSPAVGDPLVLVGHPSGLPLKIAAGASVRRVSDEFLVTNTDSFAGNSGSAVFNLNTHEIEGVLVRGEKDFVWTGSCAETYKCHDTDCRGEDVTLISQVLEALHTPN